MCVGDKYNMLLTVLAILVTNINYFFYISLGHQHSKDVTNIENQWSTSTNRQRHHCHPLMAFLMHQSSKRSQYRIVSSPNVKYCSHKINNLRTCSWFSQKSRVQNKLKICKIKTQKEKMIVSDFIRLFK